MAIIKELKREGRLKLLNLKVPFGTAKMVRVTGAKYLAWEDAFEVDFEDGLTFLEPHETIRKANKILRDARPVRVELDEEPCIGFFVHYDDGQIAEVSCRSFASCHLKFRGNKVLSILHCPSRQSEIGDPGNGNPQNRHDSD